MRQLCYLICLCVTLQCRAGDTVTLWQYEPLHLAVRSLPSEGIEKCYQVSFTDHGRQRQFNDTIVLMDIMNFDSARVYLRQLDGHGQPELVFQPFYQFFGSGKGGSILITESVLLIWNIDSGKEIFSCVPDYAHHVWQTYYYKEDSNQTLYSDCVLQYDVTIGKKNEITLTGLKNERSGDFMEQYICPELDDQIGLYKINKSGIYELVKDDTRPAHK